MSSSHTKKLIYIVLVGIVVKPLPINLTSFVTVKAATGKKCARCWTYSDTVGQNAEHPEICERCARVIGE